MNARLMKIATSMELAPSPALFRSPTVTNNTTKCLRFVLCLCRASWLAKCKYNQLARVFNLCFNIITRKIYIPLAAGWLLVFYRPYGVSLGCHLHKIVQELALLIVAPDLSCAGSSTRRCQHFLSPFGLDKLGSYRSIFDVGLLFCK